MLFRSTGPHRPSLAADVEVLLAGQLEERTPRYRAVADLVLDTTTATPEEVVAAIVAALPASSDRDPGRPAAGSPPRGAC